MEVKIFNDTTIIQRVDCAFIESGANDSTILSDKDGNIVAVIPSYMMVIADV